MLLQKNIVKKYLAFLPDKQTQEAWKWVREPSLDPLSYQEEQEVRMCLLSSNRNEILNIDTSRLIHKIRLSPFYSPVHNKKEKSQLEEQFKELSSLIELSHLYES